MGKLKDLNEFDMGQTVMPSWLGRNMSKTAALVRGSSSQLITNYKNGQIEL